MLTGGMRIRVSKNKVVEPLSFMGEKAFVGNERVEITDYTIPIETVYWFGFNSLEEIAQTGEGPETAVLTTDEILERSFVAPSKIAAFAISKAYRQRKPSAKRPGHLVSRPDGYTIGALMNDVKRILLPNDDWTFYGRKYELSIKFFKLRKIRG